MDKIEIGRIILQYITVWKHTNEIVAIARILVKYSVILKALDSLSSYLVQILRNTWDTFIAVHNSLQNGLTFILGDYWGDS